MRILLPTLPEPPDVVMQGAVIGDTPMGFPFEPWPNRGLNWAGEAVLQGEITLSAMAGDAVPRAMIGWMADFAVPSEIGPMAMQGGIVGMVPIGPAKPVNPIIDPQQRFLASALPLDSTGTWYPTPNEVVTSEPEPLAWSATLGGSSVLADLPVPANPPAPIILSGRLKKVTTANLPAAFGLKIYDNVVSSQQFTLTGTTTDGSGAALGNCRVIAYQTGWQYVGNAPVIIAETVSDGSGAFTLQLRNIDYQLTAYKPGSPDLAGITRNNVTPVAAVNVYLRDPTIPITPGASSGMSRSRVANA